MKDIDEVNIHDSELDTVIDTFIDYLKNSDALKKEIDEFYPEWPDANGGEEEVTLSVHTVNAEHEPRMRTLKSKTDIVGDPVKAAALFKIGAWDFDIQVDIWTPYKAKRNELYKKFHDLINAEFMSDGVSPAGLSLTLKNYFDTIARYEIVGYNFPDDERSSQDDSWRVRIDMKVHFDKMIELVLNKITETVIVIKDQDTDEEYISERVEI